MVQAYFDRPGKQQRLDQGVRRVTRTPTGSALGLRNLPNYIARLLLKTRGLRPLAHLDSEEQLNVTRSIAKTPRECSLIACPSSGPLAAGATPSK